MFHRRNLPVAGRSLSAFMTQCVRIFVAEFNEAF